MNVSIHDGSVWLVFGNPARKRAVGGRAPCARVVLEAAMKLEWFDRPRRGERAVAERSRAGKKEWAYWTGEESTGEGTGHRARPRTRARVRRHR